MSRIPRCCVVVALVLAAIGCSRPTSPPAAPAGAIVPIAPTAPLAEAPSAPPNSTAGGEPHGGGGGGEKALSADGAKIATASVEFELPATWRREQPSSGMRLAQAVVPGEAGPGELAVFHFGAGKGGSVESNFERWLGQIDQADGEEPERGDFAAGGFEVSWIDARGTLLPSSMGSGPSDPTAGIPALGRSRRG